MLKKTTILMLEALRHSSNQNTREHAIDILEDRPVAFSTTKAHILASEGILGGFLQVVMSGDIKEALGRADHLNQWALKDIAESVGIKIKYWADD